jgi:hypothetical protein
MNQNSGVSEGRVERRVSLVDGAVSTFCVRFQP